MRMATAVESVPSALSDAAMGAPASIGAAVLLIVGEPISENHKELILSEVTKGFSTWNAKAAGIDINEELAQIANRADLGDEGPDGERVIALRSDIFSIEILINPQNATVKAALQNFLTESTQYRHLIYAGHGFQGSGEWILQDSTFSFADFAHCFKDTDVENALKQQNGGILTVNCFAEGDWNNGHIGKYEFAKSLQVALNPSDKLENINGILQFAAYVSNFIKAKSVNEILKSSDIVGNIRFNRPTLYVFPGCQGDSALFGISGFNLLVNGGFSKRSCFWDFTRHLDRIDACLLTHLGADNLFGISSVLQKKNLENVHPEIGFMYLNSGEKMRHSPSGSVDREIQKEPSLLINLAEEGSKIIEFSKQLGQIPHPCSRSLSGQHLDPVNLFHKVGQGSLDMYILNPLTDSKELKDFYQQWNKQVPHFGSQMQVPLPNMMSICALLVWRPANPMEKITRILFPGNAPQHKLIEGLERMKNVDFLKHPSCCQHDLHKPVSKRPPAGATRPTSARLTTTRTPPVKVEPPRRSEPKPTETPRTKSTVASRPSKGLKEDVNKKAAKTTKEKSDKPKSASSSPSKTSTQSTTPSGTPKQVASPTDASPVKRKPESPTKAAVSEAAVSAPVVDNLIDVSPTPEPQPLVNHVFKEEPIEEAAPTNQVPAQEPMKPESPEPLPDPDQFAAETFENGIKQEKDLQPQVAASPMDKQTLEELGIYDEDEEAYPSEASEPMDHKEAEPEDEIKPQPLPEPIAYPEMPLSQEPDVIPENAYHKEAASYEDASPLDSPVDQNKHPVGFQAEPDLVPTIQEDTALDSEPSGVLTPPTDELRSPVTEEADALKIDRSETIPTPEEINQIPVDELAEPYLNRNELDQHLMEQQQEVNPPPPREQSPEPLREPSPEPVREYSPELIKEKSPEPIREQSPEPLRELSPEPVREYSPELIKEKSPEPIREQSPEPLREPSPEPVREYSPELIKEKSPEPIREQSPEPPKEQSPEPLREQSPEPSPEFDAEAVREQSPELVREHSPESVRVHSPEPMREHSPEPHPFEPNVGTSDEMQPDILPQQVQTRQELPNQVEMVSTDAAAPQSIESPFESGAITTDPNAEVADMMEPQPEMYGSIYEPREVTDNVSEKEDDEIQEKKAFELETQIKQEEVGITDEDLLKGQLDKPMLDAVPQETEVKQSTDVSKKSYEELGIYDESDDEEDTEMAVPVSGTEDSQVSGSGPYVYEKDVDVSDEESIQSQERPEAEEHDSFGEDVGECQQQEVLKEESEHIPEHLQEDQMKENKDDHLYQEEICQEQVSTLPEAFEKDETPQPIESSTMGHVSEPSAKCDHVQSMGQDREDDTDSTDSVDDQSSDEDKDVVGSYGQAEKQVSGAEEQWGRKEVKADDVCPSGAAFQPSDMVDQHYNPFFGIEQQVQAQPLQADAQANQGFGLNPFAHEFVPEKFDDNQEEDAFDPLAEWGKPMGLPSPPPPEAKADDSAAPKGDAKDPKKSAGSPVKSKPGDKRPGSASLNKSTANGVPDSKSKPAPKATSSPRKAPIPERKPAPPKTTRPASAPARDANTSKTEPRTRPTPATSRRPATATGSRSSPLNAKAPPLPPVTAFYVNLTYIPNHGHPSYSDVEFFKRVRARYYVLSALSPNPQILNSLLEAKKTWGDNDLEVTIIPTYDNDTLQHWMGLHKNELNDLKIDVAPSANRCTIHLQDHETSSSAYRLEF